MNPDFTDKKTLEKYSSAFTLSDMEIFIFPELLYSLLLANIMSPVIWRWREDPWFANIEKMSEYVLKILSDSHLKQELSTNARAHALKNFHNNIIVPKYLDLYQEVLDNEKVK